MLQEVALMWHVTASLRTADTFVNVVPYWHMSHSGLLLPRPCVGLAAGLAQPPVFGGRHALQCFLLHGVVLGVLSLILWALASTD